MNNTQLEDLPWYSRVQKGGEQFNFYFIERGKAVCIDDKGKEFELDSNTEVTFISSMEEHDLSK